MCCFRSSFTCEAQLQSTTVLRSRLNDLRRSRNDLAHGKGIDVSDKAQDLLKAAVFGLHFFRFVSDVLSA